jgi:hypothetical protein
MSSASVAYQREREKKSFIKGLTRLTSKVVPEPIAALPIFRNQLRKKLFVFFVRKKVNASEFKKTLLQGSFSLTATQVCIGSKARKDDKGGQSWRNAQTWEVSVCGDELLLTVRY